MWRREEKLPGPPAAQQIHASAILCAATVELPNIMPDSSHRNTFGNSGLQHGNITGAGGCTASSFLSSIS